MIAIAAAIGRKFAAKYRPRNAPLYLLQRVKKIQPTVCSPNFFHLSVLDRNSIIEQRYRKDIQRVLYVPRCYRDISFQRSKRF